MSCYSATHSSAITYSFISNPDGGDFAKFAFSEYIIHEHYKNALNFQTFLSISKIFKHRARFSLEINKRIVCDYQILQSTYLCRHVMRLRQDSLICLPVSDSTVSTYIVGTLKYLILPSLVALFFYLINEKFAPLFTFYHLITKKKSAHPALLFDT